MLPQKLKYNLKYENPDENFCAPHTLSNAGKQATVVANYSEYFRNKFQKVIQYPGKSRYHARDCFWWGYCGCWWGYILCKIWTIFQISTYSPKKLWRKFYMCATKTIGQKIWQRSCYRHMALRKSWLIWVCWYCNLQLLLMASIFFRKCHILEGDSAIILISDEVFKMPEHVIDEKYEWPSVHRVVNDDLGLIMKWHDTFLYQKQISSTDPDMAKLTVIEANERMQGPIEKKQKITGVTPQRGFYRVNTTSNTNSE